VEEVFTADVQEYKTPGMVMRAYFARCAQSKLRHEKRKNLYQQEQARSQRREEENLRNNVLENSIRCSELNPSECETKTVTALTNAQFEIVDIDEMHVKCNCLISSISSNGRDEYKGMIDGYCVGFSESSDDILVVLVDDKRSHVVTYCPFMCPASMMADEINNKRKGFLGAVKNLKQYKSFMKTSDAVPLRTNDGVEVFFLPFLNQICDRKMKIAFETGLVRVHKNENGKDHMFRFTRKGDFWFKESNLCEHMKSGYFKLNREESNHLKLFVLKPLRFDPTQMRHMYQIAVSAKLVLGETYKSKKKFLQSLESEDTRNTPSLRDKSIAYNLAGNAFKQSMGSMHRCPGRANSILFYASPLCTCDISLDQKILGRIQYRKLNSAKKRHEKV